jgi:hypothetical protein
MSGSPDQPAPVRLGLLRTLRPDLPALALLTLVFVVVFHRLPSGVMGSAGIIRDLLAEDDVQRRHLPWVAPIQMDVWRVFHGYHLFQYREALAGRLAMWNPYAYLGHPFLANAQSGMFHPGCWPHYLFDPQRTLGWLAVGRLWLSALAMHALARRLGHPPMSAMTAGLVWSFSAYNVRWLQWTAISHAALILPALALALDRLAEAPDRRRFALAALVAGLMQLSGHPESQLFVGVVAGVFCLGRILSRTSDPATILARVATLALAMTFGLAVAAVSLLPFGLELRDSIDVRGSLHDQRVTVPPSALALALSPDRLGRPRAGHEYLGPANYNLVAVWIGVVPLALAGLGLLAGIRRGDPARRWHLLAGLTMLATLAAAYGGEPVTRAWSAVPGLALVKRFYLQLGWAFFGALLAAAGLKLLADPRQERWRLVFLGLFGAIVAVRLALAATGPLRSLLKINPRLDWLERVQHPAMQEFGLLLALGAALIGLIGLTIAGWPDGTLARGCLRLIPLAIAGELGWHAFELNPIGPPQYTWPDIRRQYRPSLRMVGADRLAATGETLAPNLSMRYGFRDLRGYDFPVPLRIGRIHEQVGIKPLDHQIPTGSLFPALTPAMEALLDRTATRFILTEHYHEPLRRSARSLGPPWIMQPAANTMAAGWKNPAALPRAFVADRFAPASATEARAALLDPKPERDPRRLALLEPAAALEDDDTIASDVPGSAVAVTGSARFLRDEPNLVELEVEITPSPTSAPAPTNAEDAPRAALVLLDRMAKGWRVFVDDQPAAAWTAHYLFRATLVTPGRHRVRWEYETPGLRAGATVTALSLVTLIALATWPARRAVESDGRLTPNPRINS